MTSCLGDDAPSDLSQADLDRIKRSGDEAYEAAITQIANDGINRERLKRDTRQVEARQENPASSVEAEIKSLAVLSEAEYEQRRKGEAKRLGVRASMLDKVVTKARGNERDNGQGRIVQFDEPPPWPEPVDGVSLLDELRRMVHRHIVLGRHAAVAVALWIVHTYALTALWISPFLCARSPVLRCGKTTLLSFIALLAYRPLATSNISPAALYRVIEAAEPTLIIDEFDTVATASDELRGLLNSGHRRSTAFVVRLVGEDHEPRQFSTFGAKVLALIGDPPSTIHDRSIVIDMQRKQAAERIVKLPEAIDAEIVRLRSMLMRFASDHIEDIRAADPVLPSLNDRAADNWSPLLRIADIAGGAWPELARNAAVELSGVSETEAEGVRVQLLADMRQLFADRKADRLLSADVCAALASMEERPWSEFGRARKPITPRQLARLLSPFGIRSRNLKQPDDSVAKGYLFQSFKESFERYKSPQSATPLLDGKSSQSLDFASATNTIQVADKKSAFPLETKQSSAVADGNPRNDAAELRVTRCPRCDGEGCPWCKNEARP